MQWNNYIKTLFTTILFVFAGTAFAQGISFLLLKSKGIDQLASNFSLTALSPNDLLKIMYLSQGLGFLLPGILASIVLFRKDWLIKTMLNQLPSFKILFISFILFLSCLHLTSVLAEINATFELSTWQLKTEKEIAALLSKVIQAPETLTFVIALIGIAVLPALGEELIFRGLIQPNLIGITRNPHLGIWITALLFAAIHMQFAGMLPRIFLGVVLGFLGYYSQRLWVPILIHLIFNGSQVIAVRMGALEASAPSVNEQTTPIQVVLALISAIGMMYILLPKLIPTDSPISEDTTDDFTNV